jgi:hypothetical protein
MLSLKSVFVSWEPGKNTVLSTVVELLTGELNNQDFMLCVVLCCVLKNYSTCTRNTGKIKMCNWLVENYITFNDKHMATLIIKPRTSCFVCVFLIV